MSCVRHGLMVRAARRRAATALARAEIVTARRVMASGRNDAKPARRKDNSWRRRTRKSAGKCLRFLIL
jgi:hypothetical protein